MAVKIQNTQTSSGKHNYTIILYLIYVRSNKLPLIKTFMYLHMITDHAFYCFCFSTAQVTMRDFVWTTFKAVLYNKKLDGQDGD